jgi:hypothetical protein
MSQIGREFPELLEASGQNHPARGGLIVKNLAVALVAWKEKMFAHWILHGHWQILVISVTGVVAVLAAFMAGGARRSGKCCQRAVANAGKFRLKRLSESQEQRLATKVEANWK